MTSTTAPSQHASDPSVIPLMPRVEAMPRLSVQTLVWLARHPGASAVAESVWGMLDELHEAGQHQGLIGALKFALIAHQPTAAGRCRGCRRKGVAQRVAPLPVSLCGTAADSG